LVGFATSNSTPGAGADIVMESITLIDQSIGVAILYSLDASSRRPKWRYPILGKPKRAR
jgi:hypothetical protein